ncbi:MAG TPA: hypothetical protein VIM28_09815 [Solirubrobacterales bacterium]
MASSGERRLVFDTRGKRKHVVRVVYAILALLMGGSLFLVVGPVNIGELFGNSSSSTSASKLFEEQAERIEGRLAKNPNDAQLLLALTRAQISAGNANIEPVAETETPTVPLEARKDFEAASQTWHRYLKQAGDEPSATAAQLVAGSFFGLAEAAPGIPSELQSHIALAAEAQKIAAEQQPNVGSLSRLAIYEYFNGEFAAGDRAMKQATATVPKAEAKNVEKQLAEYRKRAVAFQKGVKKAAKQEQQTGKEALQSPLGGVGGG